MRKILLLLIGVLAFSTFLLAQNRTITGRITDAQGNGVPIASVVVKGSTVGTTTATDGSFSLNIPSNARALVVTSVGFAPSEISISNQNVINVQLRTESQNLNEVVVVAYGTSRKEALTGSVGQVSAEQIERRPIGNITKVLEGTIPGVVTTSGSGQPGNGLSIRVRGFGSINATSEPLLVVDGVPYIGGTSNINPDDVASISVLKDASSTALYGSRAANGVVMITTKKGRKGRNNISARLMQGVATRGLEEYERINAFQYYPITFEAYRNSLIYPSAGVGISMDSANRVAAGLTSRTSTYDQLSYNPFNVPNNAIVGVNGQLNPNAQLLYADDLDWTKDLLRNGTRRDYSVNFSGGADKSDYFISIGYLNEDGYTIKTDFERYSARLNVNVQPKTWIKTGLNISGNYSTSNVAQDGGGLVNPFAFSRYIGPIYPVYSHNMTTGALILDANGQKVYDLGNFGSTPFGIANGIKNRPSGANGGRHGIAEILLDQDVFRRNVVSARSTTDIMFLNNFRFTNNVAVDFQTQSNTAYDNQLVGDGAPGGRSNKSTNSSTGFIASQILNYAQTFKTSHRFDALVGHESFNQYDNNLGGFKQGQSLSGNIELSNFTTITSSTSSVDKYRIESFFSRLNYDYQSKYLLSASLRRDGNSRFAPESRWGTFWSAGAGWNLHKENFMENIGWLNLLKLRGSYGVVGVADGIGFYAYQGLYVFANVGNEPGIVQSQTAFLNKELTWEENRQADIGVDFTLFKNRLNGSFEYYNRVSADLLFAVPQPLSSGALTVQQNTATMYNRGIELQLSGDIIRGKDFIWNSSVNLSTVTNKITKMPETVPEFITGTKKYQVGSSIFDYWIRSYYGVDPSDGSALFLAANTAPSTNRRLITNKNGGVDTVTTLASNGKFEYHGSAIPDFYGSFGQSFSFKPLTLSALFTFQIGGETYDDNYAFLMSAGTYGRAFHTDILKRWQKPGDITDVPRLDVGRTTDFNAISSRWLIDASYLNIRNITLAYTLPQSVVSRLKLADSQFFISAENVAFFSKRKGLNNQNAFTGITDDSYPPARVITAGLTLNF